MLGLDRLRMRTGTGAPGRPVTQADLSDLWMLYQSVLYAHGVDLFRHEGVIDLMALHRDRLTPPVPGDDRAWAGDQRR